MGATVVDTFGIAVVVGAATAAEIATGVIVAVKADEALVEVAAAGAVEGAPFGAGACHLALVARLILTTDEAAAAELIDGDDEPPLSSAFDLTVPAAAGVRVI